MTLKQEDTMFAVMLTTIGGDKFFATIGDTAALYHWKRAGRYGYRTFARRVAGES
jgi:hypothetical protein